MPVFGVLYKCKYAGNHSGMSRAGPRYGRYVGESVEKKPTDVIVGYLSFILQRSLYARRVQYCVFMLASVILEYYFTSMILPPP